MIPRKQEARNDASSITTPTITTKPKTDRKKNIKKGKEHTSIPKSSTQESPSSAPGTRARQPHSWCRIQPLSAARRQTALTMHPYTAHTSPRPSATNTWSAAQHSTARGARRWWKSRQSAAAHTIAIAIAAAAASSAARFGLDPNQKKRPTALRFLGLLAMRQCGPAVWFGWAWAVRLLRGHRHHTMSRW